MEVIPAIDLLGGKVVRLYKGDFNQVTEYPDPPVEVAARYGKAGVESLHIVDLDGALCLLDDLVGLPCASSGNCFVIVKTKIPYYIDCCYL